jgi:ribosomal protein S18
VVTLERERILNKYVTERSEGCVDPLHVVTKVHAKHSPVGTTLINAHSVGIVFIQFERVQVVTLERERILNKYVTERSEGCVDPLHVVTKVHAKHSPVGTTLINAHSEGIVFIQFERVQVVTLERERILNKYVTERSEGCVDPLHVVTKVHAKHNPAGKTE